MKCSVLPGGGKAFPKEARLFASVHIPEPLFSQPWFKVTWGRPPPCWSLLPPITSFKWCFLTHRWPRRGSEMKHYWAKSEAVAEKQRTWWNRGKEETLLTATSRKLPSPVWTSLSKEHDMSMKTCMQNTCSGTVFLLAAGWVTLIMKVPLLNGL